MEDGLLHIRNSAGLGLRCNIVTQNYLQQQEEKYLKRQ